MQKFFAGGEISRLRVGVGRAEGGVAQIPGLLQGVRAIAHQVCGRERGRQLPLKGLAGLLPVIVGPSRSAEHEVGHAADHWQEEDRDDPGHFIGQFRLPGGDEQGHEQADGKAGPVEIDEVAREAEEHQCVQ